MANWKGIVGLSFSPEDFDRYCHTLRWNAWRPTFFVLHNTAAPSLADRPSGLTRTHIGNLESYYRDKQGWSAGPHLFIDDRQIWVFTPLTLSGVHSPSWNKVAIGVEMLGNYEHERFDSGRGMQVRTNTLAALASLCATIGIEPGTMKLHREDHLTSHASCPGSNVSKDAMIEDVRRLLVDRHGGEHDAGDTA